MNSSMPHAASGRPLKPVAPLVRAKTEQAAVDLPFFHRAEWLVPVAFPPIQDGAVLVRGSQILAAGPYAQVKAASPANTKQVDHGSSAIMPALVNAHTHLELSGLCGHIGLPQESFAQWLKELLSLRPSMTPERLQAGFLTGLSQLTASGCGLYGDITNGACLQTDAKWHARLAPANDEGKQVFLEVLGFDREGLADALGPDLVQALSMAASVKLPLSLAAHASYSTSGAVIHEAKEWCRRRGLRFSIHVAEHLDEIEFLKNGTGFCRELLESLGRWTPYWTPPGSTPVRYLEQLQVLDAQTLLVHAVHMTDADWEIVIKNQCPVCFCPRSNRNLNVGQPDLGKALRCGVVTALGTDSLASNTDLDLFAEAAHVLENYADMPPEAILQMITLGGAKALGQEQQFGTIEPGKRSHLLAVSLPESFPSHQLFETIIQRGNKGARRWAHHPAKGCA